MLYYFLVIIPGDLAKYKLGKALYTLPPKCRPTRLQCKPFPLQTLIWYQTEAYKVSGSISNEDAHLKAVNVIKYKTCLHCIYTLAISLIIKPTISFIKLFRIQSFLPTSQFVCIGFSPPLWDCSSLVLSLRVQTPTVSNWQCSKVISHLVCWYYPLFLPPVLQFQCLWGRSLDMLFHGPRRQWLLTHSGIRWCHPPGQSCRSCLFVV